MKKLILLLAICVQTAFSQSVLDLDFGFSGLYAFNENNKWGYVDVEGKIIIPAKYKSAENFSNGLGKVSVDGNNYGYIDKSGTLIFKTIYFSGTDFTDGAAFVSIKKGNDVQWNVLNKNGELYPVAKFSYKGTFCEGLARVKTQSDLWGFIDTKGKFVIEPKYESAGDFSEGLCCVSIKNRWGFINAKGEMIIQPQFTTIGKMEFTKGLAGVRLHEERENGLYKTGFIDKSGVLQNTDWLKKIDDEAKYEVRSVGDPHDGFSIVYASGENFAIINTQGEILMDFKHFDLLYDFSNGLAAFQEANEAHNGLWGFINEKGEEIIKAQYSVLTSFDQNGLAFFEKKEGALIVNGYLNKTGKIIKHWSYKG